MGEILRWHLQEVFGREALFLHGGVQKAQRDRMVERFQAGGDGPQIFLLPLKAGGVAQALSDADVLVEFEPGARAVGHSLLGSKGDDDDS